MYEVYDVDMDQVIAVTPAFRAAMQAIEIQVATDPEPRISRYKIRDQDSGEEVFGD